MELIFCVIASNCLLYLFRATISSCNNFFRCSFSSWRFCKEKFVNSLWDVAWVSDLICDTVDAGDLKEIVLALKDEPGVPFEPDDRGNKGLPTGATVPFPETVGLFGSLGGRGGGW